MQLPSDPAIISAYATAVVIILVGQGRLIWWICSKKTTKKVLDDNGLERRKDTITKTEHEECRKNRVATEDRLFKGQNKLEDKIEGVRLEVKDDIQRVYKNQDTTRKEICDKIDNLRK